jgi:signal transduction histidine kinase
MDSDNILLSRWSLLTIRVIGHYFLAIILIFMTDLGADRFLFAGLLAFLFAPVALLLSLRFTQDEFGWHDTLVDLVALIVFAFLSANLWYLCLLMGVVVVLIPNVSTRFISIRKMVSTLMVLLVGLSAAGYYNSVEQWYIPILFLACACPTIFLYTYGQILRISHLRSQANAYEEFQESAGGIVHDYKNQLMAVSGHAELARLKLSSDDAAATHIDGIIHASARASELAESLLDRDQEPVDAEPR